MNLPLVYSVYETGITTWVNEVPQSYFEREHIAKFYPRPSGIGEISNYDPIRFMDRVSIRAYMEVHRDLLKGRVLDFGAGNQPYRDLVEGDYVPWDLGTPFNWGPYDAVMCNQVLQYTNDPPSELADCFVHYLKPGGHLVMTFATNWDEVSGDVYKRPNEEYADRWRFTAKGMEYLLACAGFEVLDVTRRCEVRVGSFCFPIGYGCVARRPE